jgi:hypothetical protein
MNKFKENRMKILDETINKLKELSCLYNKGMPAWTLIQNAYGHINSIKFLEEKNFDEKTLGVKSDEL